jgi:FixJ family two-component response regulator
MVGTAVERPFLPTRVGLSKGKTLQQAALIACVDDDPTVLEAMKDLLDASGFQVDGFSSAEEFLNRGQLEVTACLITDVQLLGGMSGLQLQDHLITRGFRIPTIVISAFADKQTRTRALGSGAVCVLSKPVNKEDLLRCIRDALHRGRDDEKV